VLTAEGVFSLVFFLESTLLRKEMIVLNKLDDALSFHQAALRIRGQRQELIAANIANADTPNYKARDIDFKAAMQSAVAGVSQETFGIAKTSALHLDGAAVNNTVPSGRAGEPLFRPIVQGSVDGNTVDMDVERNQFADNGIRYEASLTLINAQLKQMLAAIQG
jgi:flagellar basal-body rod protein FlgB